MAAVGQKLQIEEIQEILEAVQIRQKKWPEEPTDISFSLVMINIGRRYTSVICSEGEWLGQVKDLQRGVAECPNGHEVWKSGVELTLGWVANNRDPQPKGNDEQAETQGDEPGGREAEAQVVDAILRSGGTESSDEAGTEAPSQEEQEGPSGS